MTRHLMPAMAWLAALSLPAAAGAAGPATGYSVDPQQSRLEFTGVQAGGRTVARMHTDSAGTFQFKTIAPGTYTISDVAGANISSIVRPSAAAIGEPTYFSIRGFVRVTG